MTNGDAGADLPLGNGDIWGVGRNAANGERRK
jgi:hypothetical protein